MRNGTLRAVMLWLVMASWFERAVFPSPQPPVPPRDSAARTSAPAATGRIRGRVVAADNGAAVAWATVLVSPSDGGRGGGSVQTDTRGAFEVAGLSPGEYRVTVLPPAHRARYLPAHFGATTPFESGIAVRVGPGEAVERIDVALPVAAAVGGRVVDDAGEALADIRVELLRSSDSPLSALEPVPAGRSRAVYTDDTGRFRLFEVAEGEYTLAAVAEQRYQRTSSSPPTFVTTFYPATADQTQSQRVSVKAGQEVEGLEIRMVRSRTFGISGSVATSDGRPVANTNVSLNRYDRFGGGGEELSLDAEGRFSAGGLTPGDYAIVVGPGRGTVNEFATVPITIVDSDVNDIVVITRPTVTVNGRVALDESIPKGQLSKVRIEVTAVDPSRKSQWIPQTVAVDADGGFTITNLFMPVIIRPLGQSEWGLKGVFLHRSDITDRPTEFQPRDSGHLEVFFTATLSRIEGRVRDDAGRPLTDCAVLLFSSVPADWVPSSSRIKLAQLQSNGDFSFTNVRPGSYRIIAIPQSRVTGGSLYRPALLDALITDATDVTVGEGERRTVDLRLVTR